ncbi:MAG: acyltransferase [Bacilli bacterium]|nr:acyltransferase [Bacilli bacterium]
MKENVKKNNTIQVMRAVAIILVLIHHSISNVKHGVILTSFDNIIICFHMPIFFIISGYLFELKNKDYLEKGRQKFIKNKLVHLILPYLFWTVILYIGVQIACKINSSFMTKIGFEPMGIFSMLKGILTYEVYYTQHLWFLYVLFVMFIINIFSTKINKKLLLFFSILIGISTYLIKYPNIIYRLFLWFPFFVVGRCIVNTNNIKSISKIKIVLSIVLFMVLALLRLNISNLIYDKTILKLISPILMYSIGVLGVYLTYVFSSNVHNNIKMKLKKIGDYSYEIYLMHNPYFVAVSSIILSSILKMPSYICIIISVAIGIVIPIFISKFVYKYASKVSIIMFGK